nr:Chain W, Pre-histone-like nucleoprotein [Human adenovirus 5]
GLRFPSKMFGG